MPRILILSCLLSLVLTGCEKKETPVRRLTAEQLTWQPYHVGDVLRFGQTRSAKVRTFTITGVNDRIETYSNAGGGIVLWPVEPSKLQKITVEALRTDTVRYVPGPTSTAAHPDSVALTSPGPLLEIGMDDFHGNSSAAVVAQVSWDYAFANYLPVEEVTAKIALPDTTARLLPSLQVGGVSYGPVLQLSNSSYGPVLLLRPKPVRRLYYAKGAGVVAFVEGSTLWYKLP